MSVSSREEADMAREELKEAESLGQRAKNRFDRIGDSEGSNKADAVVKVAKEAKEHVERKFGKENN